MSRGHCCVEGAHPQCRDFVPIRITYRDDDRPDARVVRKNWYRTNRPSGSTVQSHGSDSIFARYRVTFSSALVPQLQLCHLHRLCPYSQRAPSIHKCRTCTTPVSPSSYYNRRNTLPPKRRRQTYSRALVPARLSRSLRVSTMQQYSSCACSMITRSHLAQAVHYAFTTPSNALCRLVCYCR